MTLCNADIEFYRTRYTCTHLVMCAVGMPSMLYNTVEKRARGGRKKKKKKAEEAPIETDWDELYDPSRPTNVDEYLRSDERIREVREWKGLLYKHKRRDNDDDERHGSWDSDEDDTRPMQSESKYYILLYGSNLLTYPL